MMYRFKGGTVYPDQVSPQKGPHSANYPVRPIKIKAIAFILPINPISEKSVHKEHGM
jgi:hypothetical protein